jgi:hypothetical protein
MITIFYSFKTYIAGITAAKRQAGEIEQLYEFEEKKKLLKAKHAAENIMFGWSDPNHHV